jgi:hypothetical protein
MRRFSTFCRLIPVLALSLNLSPAQAQKGELKANIDTVTVRAKGDARRMGLTFHETIIGFDFLGDSILMASRTTKGDGRLILLSPSGTVVQTHQLHKAPQSLFSICTGGLYLLFDSGVSAVQFGEKGLEHGELQPISLFAKLAPCTWAGMDRIYFKHIDPVRFRVSYAVKHTYDSSVTPFYTISDAPAARSSAEEYEEAMALLQAGQFAKAAQVFRKRKLWDDIVFQYLDTRMLMADAGPVIVDKNHNKLHFFTTDGNLLKSVPFGFQPGLRATFQIIRDEATGRFYFHGYADKAVQTLQEIALDTGLLIGESVQIRKPFAESVRIQRGRIYYLWQPRNGETRALYVQPGFVSE